MLFFIDSKILEEFCFVNITINKLSEGTGAPSCRQVQIIKCRELIFTEQDVLASPAMTSDQVVHVILKRSMLKTGRLQTRVKRMGVEIDNPLAVTTSMFEACLKYTILAKIAPQWNKIGRYLVQGRDFVANCEKMNAVEFSLSVNSSEVTLSVDAAVIKAQPLKLNQLEVPVPVMKKFFTTRTNLGEHSIGNRWCYVLPSMKKGQIVGVCSSFPASTVFATYKDLKRHWKNTYGYRLPESEETMLFYQVYFKPIGNTLFTYPECCLRKNDVTVFPRCDSFSIVRSFLRDVFLKVPSICGDKLYLRSQNPSFPSLDVTLASSVMADDQSKNVNLTCKIPHCLQKVQLSVNKPPIGSYNKQEQQLPQQKQQQQKKQHQQQQNQESSYHHARPKNINIIPSFKPVPKGPSFTSSLSTSSAPRIVPVFTAKGSKVQKKSPSTSDDALAARKKSRVQLHKPTFQRTNAVLLTHGEVCKNTIIEKGNATNTEEMSNSWKRKAESQDVGHQQKTDTKKTKNHDVDVAQLARSNMLGKVTTATLLTWLKRKGVKCSARDKKSELIVKVNQALSIATHEQ